MSDALHLAWDEFDVAVSILSKVIVEAGHTSVWGVPRGGLVLAVAVSHESGLPFVLTAGQGSAIIDDRDHSSAVRDAALLQSGSQVFWAWVGRSDPACLAAIDLPPGDARQVVFPWERPQ